MATRIYQVFQRDAVTDEMLLWAAKLFSQHYGVWGRGAPVLKQGKPVTMSANQLRANFLPTPDSWYATVIIGGLLVGHAFASLWVSRGQLVCWVTQLVVARGYRRHGLAKNLLRVINDGRAQVFGILSPHPAACLAITAALDCGPLEHVNFDFMRENAKYIAADSPVPYLRAAKLCGCAFGDENGTASGVVSGADTKFFVDHEESLNAVGEVCRTRFWPLGRDLPDGYEFLLIMRPKDYNSDSSDE